jgi:outer membrane protein assembly factor BamB
MKRALTFSLLLSANILVAGDWPEFRGPGAQGNAGAVNLPVEFGPGKNLKWKVAVPGAGWSSPVILDGRIYLTTANVRGAGLSLAALCLDARTGRMVWNQTLFSVIKSPRMHRKNSQASPTPIVKGQRLFVHFGHMGTACLDLNGKPIWKNDTIKYPPVHGNGGTPVLVNGKLIFSCDGASNPFVIALNAQTGKTVWRTPRKTNAKKKFSFSTPLVVKFGDKTQVLLPGSNMIGAYDHEDGKEIWRITYNGYSVIPRPVAGHGMVFFSSGFDRPVAMAVRLGGHGDVTASHLTWTINKSAPHTPSMLLERDELYMVSDGGIASCVDAKRGTVYWNERLGGSYSASPILAGGKIYFVSEAGVANVISIGKKFKLLAKNDLGERCLASPAVANGALFIRTAEHLWKFQR